MTIARAARLYKISYKLLRRAVLRGFIRVTPHPTGSKRYLILPGQEEKLQALADFYRLLRGDKG